MQVGDTAIYWHGMRDRLFTVEITKVSQARVEARILDGQCRLSDRVTRFVSFTHRQAQGKLIGA